MQQNKKALSRRKPTKNVLQSLLIIDMLNDFVLKEAPLRVPGAKRIVPNIKSQLKLAREKAIPVIYLCDTHQENDLEFKIWPKHAVRGTKGAQIIEELKPQKQDLIIRKSRYSGFYNTNLDKILKKLGIEELIITGLLTNVCVLYTAVDAYMRGYRVQILEDCIIALNKEDHKFAIRQIKDVLKPYW